MWYVPKISAPGTNTYIASSTLARAISNETLSRQTKQKQKTAMLLNNMFNNRNLSFFKRFIYFSYLNVLPACMYVPREYLLPVGVRRHQISWKWS